MLLAPERAYKIDETAAAILQLVDGRRDLAEIISAIAEKYAEDRTVIAGDVEEMLLGLAAKGVLNL
jgi:pyrroloquinoline quinone biosynthesis protein D